jgi:hypothetical protein
MLEEDDDSFLSGGALLKFDHRIYLLKLLPAFLIGLSAAGLICSKTSSSEKIFFSIM